jgi:hypothetical protein
MTWKFISFLRYALQFPIGITFSRLRFPNFLGLAIASIATKINKVCGAILWD